MEERNDGDPERYKSRLAELHLAQEKVVKLIAKAEKKGKKIKIDAEIKIVILEE